MYIYALNRLWDTDRSSRLRRLNLKRRAITHFGDMQCCRFFFMQSHYAAKKACHMRSSFSRASKKCQPTVQERACTGLTVYMSPRYSELENAGLVRRTRRGRENTIELSARPLRQVADWALNYERFWSVRMDRLEKFFAAKKEKSR